MVGWLRLTSHRQRGHLETTPPFTVPCEGREARFLHHTHQESYPRPLRGSLWHYRCATPARLLYTCMPVWWGLLTWRCAGPWWCRVAGRMRWSWCSLARPYLRWSASRRWTAAADRWTCWLVASDSCSPARTPQTLHPHAENEKNKNILFSNYAPSAWERQK